ncbi:PI-PLC X domain-containing protein 1 [Mactra antiquata]
MAGRWTNWMADLPCELWTHPLCSLAIPGSHNSLSFYVEREANVDRKIEPIFGRYVEYFGEMAAEISHRWTQTQCTSVTEQLNKGIRYLDIRVTARSGDDKNVFYRNGPNILKILREIRRWSDRHPQEIVLLDFRVVNRLSSAQHRYLLANMTQDVFEGKMLECTGHVKGVTLRNMWAIGASLIVFYPKECVFEYKTVWPSEYMGFVLSESQTAEGMIQALDTVYTEGRPPHIFYCWQGVMIPNNEYISKNLDKTLKDKMSRSSRRATLNWARDKDIHEGQINVIVADFVDLDDFCKEIILVNRCVRKLKRYEFESRTCNIS